MRNKWNVELDGPRNIIARNVHFLRNIARMTHLDDQTISALIETGDSRIHKRLLDNPNLSSKHIKTICRMANDEETTDKGAEHPNADDFTKSYWASNEMRMKLLDKPDLDTHHVMNTIMRTSDPDVHLKAMDHPSYGHSHVMHITSRANLHSDVHLALMDSFRMTEKTLERMNQHNFHPKVVHKAASLIRNGHFITKGSERIPGRRIWK